MTHFLDPVVVGALQRIGKLRRFTPGLILLAEGSVGNEVLLIRKGRLKVVAVTESGNSTLLALRGPGDLVGEFSVLDRSPRSASLVALEDGEVLVIPADNFRRFLQENPAVRTAVLETVLSRLRESDQRWVEFSGYDTHTRLGMLLLSLADQHGTPVPGGGQAISLPLSQQDLAHAIGASRESVARGLAGYRRSSRLRTGRREIVLEDPAALRAEVTRRVVDGSRPPPGSTGRSVYAEHSDHRHATERAVHARKVTIAAAVA